MKISFKLVVSTIVFLFIVSNQTTQAQFLKKLKKKIERKVEDKIDKKVDKEIDKTLDGEEKKVEEKTKETKENTDNQVLKNDKNEQTKEMNDEKSNISDNLEIYSKFDFVPGDKLLFFDDFSQDFIGDFPSKWNTNASGEIIRTKNSENWFELKSGYGVYFIPDVKDLPEDYTIEFDLLTQGINNQTSSTANFFVILSDNDTFNDGTNHYAKVSIPVGQYAPFSLRARNYFNRRPGTVNTDIKADVRKAILNQPHIAIAVTKKRYRLWINEKKYVDIPRFIEKEGVIKNLKFHINNFKDGEEHLFIRNLKVSEGGVDLRRKLLNEGKISTNGILFDSGSDKIQPQSYGIIRQISQVLMQDDSIKLNIIGHTDADGDDTSNLELSKKRAAAVKNALINIYKIDGSRLQTDGKGETVPIGDNTTVDGKAQNRRVEFVKIN